MKKIIIVIAVVALGILFIPKTDPRRIIASTPASTPITDEITIGGSLPQYGVLCVNTTVHSGPRNDATILYNLPAGTRVRLRDQSRGSDRSWAMIQRAEWIKLSTLCDW